MKAARAQAAVPEDLKRDVVAHYERQLARYGPTARGMDWKDEASQRLRFEVLCDVCDLTGRSVHEIGAGAGHLVDHLRERGIAADYSGSDLSPAMVEAARARHADVAFDCRDPLADDDAGPWDVVLCSGLFHVKLGRDDDEWWHFVSQTVRRMWQQSRVAIAFNLMSDRVDFRSPTLYYANPGAVLAFCQDELSRRVAIRHDYPLHEFTVHVHRDED